MIKLLNTDCMTYMKGLEDNAFDLAASKAIKFGGTEVNEDLTQTYTRI